MTLDADAAWRLVLALADRPCDRHGAADVVVRPDGTWQAPEPPSPEARAILDLYLPLAACGAWVLGHLGQSLDGRIACASGHSHALNDAPNLDHLHRLRALSDAIVVGAGTALADDPRLTTRRCVGASPVRVVLAGRRPLDPGLNLFIDGAAPTLVMRTDEAAEGPPGVECRTVAAGPDGAPSPAAVVAALAGRGLRRIFVEGGGLTVSAFLAAGALDRLQVCVAPLLIGSGVPALTLPPVASLDDAVRLHGRWIAMGRDMLLDVPLEGEKDTQRRSSITAPGAAEMRITAP